MEAIEAEFRKAVAGDAPDILKPHMDDMREEIISEKLSSQNFEAALRLMLEVKPHLTLKLFADGKVGNVIRLSSSDPAKCLDEVASFLNAFISEKGE